MNAIQKSNKKIDAKLTKELDILYPAVALVLWQEYGWRRTRIERLFLHSQDVWQECADGGVEESMLTMLERETGIEIQVPGMKSYHEYPYLDAKAWDRKQPTEMQVLYIRQQQAKWLPAMMIASMCLSLYRKEKWGGERVARFVSLLEQKKAEYGANTKLYVRELEDVTDFKKEELTRYRYGKRDDGDVCNMQ